MTKLGAKKLRLIELKVYVSPDTKNGNNFERDFCEILSFRQSRNKVNMFNLFQLCRKDEISFDIVAKNGSTVRLVAFDNVASTLLLVWTGL